MSRKELLKRYLSRYNKARSRIKELEALRRQIERDAGSPKSPSDGSSPRVQTNSVSGGAAEFALRIVETDERIIAQKAQLSVLLSEILDVFDFLPLESDERAVLELRYLQDKKVPYICKTRYISRSTFYALCDKGIKELLKSQKIIKTLKRYEKELKDSEA
jgi:hypothetical protein